MERYYCRDKGGEMTQNEQFYRTSDLGLAAYLVYEKMTLLGPVATEDPKRHALYFLDAPDRERFVFDYLNNRTQVDARVYSQCAHKVARELRNPLISEV